MVSKLFMIVKTSVINCSHQTAVFRCSFAACTFSSTCSQVSAVIVLPWNTFVMFVSILKHFNVRSALSRSPPMVKMFESIGVTLVLCDCKIVPYQRHSVDDVPPPPEMRFRPVCGGNSSL